MKTTFNHLEALKLGDRFFCSERMDRLARSEFRKIVRRWIPARYMPQVKTTMEIGKGVGTKTTYFLKATFTPSLGAY